MTDTIRADAERVRTALYEGGRIVVTVRSKATGAHVTLAMNAKAEKDGRLMSRRTREGRVGLNEADVLFVDTPEGDYVGRLNVSTGNVSFGRAASAPDRWTTEKVLAYAAGQFDLDAVAEVFLAAQCTICGKRLTDPESIERHVGPECHGRQTASRRAQRTLAEAA